jgi:hypothetical protein
MELNIACCLCIRNCANFLPKIFDNLNLLGKEFKSFHIIFVYDNCNDNSAKLLEEYKINSKFNVHIINNIKNKSIYRTVRIANSRNVYLNIINNEIKNIDYHIVIDADDVNISPWNIDIIKYYLNNNNDWDAISFNRPEYYDIWALLYNNFKHHCWGFKQNSVKIHNHMKNDITNELKNMEDDKLFECYSAFNGFAIYKTDKFKNCVYNGLYKNITKLITDNDRQNTIIFLNKIFSNVTIHKSYTQHCEHIYYHLTAIKMNNAKIRISKKII